MPCNLVNSHDISEKQCLHLWGLTCLTLKMETPHSSEMLTTIFQLTHCNVLEVLKCYHSCNNIKLNIFSYYYPALYCFVYHLI